MIIKSTRHATGDSQTRILNHLVRGDENDRVQVLRGTEADISDMFRDAARFKTAFAIRQFIIAPAEAMTRDQALRVVHALGEEFRFNSDRVFVVEHEKQRAMEEVYPVHWHLVVPEVETVTGKVLSSSNDYARQEKIARVVEDEFGHQIILGAHTKSVSEALRREGRIKLAERLEAELASQIDRPEQAYTSVEHAAAKRQGMDLPGLRLLVRDAWRSTETRDQLIAKLGEIGVEIQRGDKPGEWVLRSHGVFAGSLRRMAGAAKDDVSQRMEGPRDAARSEDNRTYHPRTDGLVGSPHESDGRGSEHSSITDGSDGKTIPGNSRIAPDRYSGSGESEPDSDRRASRSVERAGHRAGNYEGDQGLGTSLLYLIQRLSEFSVTTRQLAMSPSDNCKQALTMEEGQCRDLISKASITRGGFDDAISGAKQRADDLQRAHSLAFVEYRAIKASAEPPPSEPSQSILGGLLSKLHSRRDSPRPVQDRSGEMAAAYAKLVTVERQMLSAKVEVTRLEKAEIAEASQIRNAVSVAQSKVEVRLLQVADERHLIRVWPAIAYCSPRVRGDAAEKIGRTRRKLRDPHAKNIWGLPVQGPGTGNY
jgi:hypothetical protein